MRNPFFILFLSLFLNKYSFSQTKVNLPPPYGETINQELKPFFVLAKGELEEVLKGEVISDGKVSTPIPKDQDLHLFVVGLHPRNCKRAMRKLALYENYSQYIDFIKVSSYDDRLQKFSFTVDHTLLPFKMLVKFKIPRIRDEGHYAFIFEDGFLKNLKGTVIVKQVEKHCLLGLKADWQGPETVIPNFVFGTFLETVGKLGLEHLIRVSLF